jgi:hypothetical protein
MKNIFYILYFICLPAVISAQDQNNYGYQNGFAISSEILPPAFSIPSGFYDSSFYLDITHPDPEADILFTLDGSEPDEANLGGTTYSYKNQYPELPLTETGPLLENVYQTHLFDEPLEVTDRSLLPNKISSISTTCAANPNYIPTFAVLKSTVVRARAVKAGFEPSGVVTANYFITSAGAELFTVPVVCLNLNEDDFFAYDNGIHVAGKDFDDWRTANPDGNFLNSNANYTRTGEEAEIKANFSYYVNGEEKINQDAGVRINGGFSRLLPNKSLRLYSREEFGQETFNYPFFQDLDDSDFKSLILRNSGSDAYSTYFRDAFIQQMVSHLNHDTQSYQPSVLFVNGEYWGLLNIRERYDKHYFKRVYNIGEDELDFLEYNGFLIQEGDYDHYANMLAFIEANDLSDDSNFEYVRTLMDTENFIDFFITNIYIRNTDWPHNNIEFWRKRTPEYIPGAAFGHDGRWRWLLKDTDFGFGADGGSLSYQHNTLAHATSVGGDINLNPEWSTLILRKLLENTNFKNDFINRFADLINTAFIPSRVSSLIDVMKAGIAEEIPGHGQRWASINSVEQWQAAIDVMHVFANERPLWQREHIKDKFGIGASINATLNVAPTGQGYIKINTVAINSSTPGVDQDTYPWTGIYFSGIPIKVKAVAAPGYLFSHWSGTSNSMSEEITLLPDADIDLTAHFVPSGLVPEQCLYFWMMDNNMPNDMPLTVIDPVFELYHHGTLEYESALEGYPFDPSHSNWRKASMERRNSPTAINYIPFANSTILYELSNMRGLQIKQPFQQNDKQNTLIFNVPTTGYGNIKMAFAAKNEGAVEAILIEYSINNAMGWITNGLPAQVLPLSAQYQLYVTDFSQIAAISNNPEFRIRIRFLGTDMEVDEGNRVTFNNISISGITELSSPEDTQDHSIVYPNPFTDKVYFPTIISKTEYHIYSADGRLIKSGIADHSETDLSDIPNGIYLLRLSSEGITATQKLVKQ